MHIFCFFDLRPPLGYPGGPIEAKHKCQILHKIDTH